MIDKKKILKETFKDIIPPKILNRKKEPLKTDAIREDKMKQRKINAQIWEDLYGQTNS